MGQTKVCLHKSVPRACVHLKIIVRTAALQNDSSSNRAGKAAVGTGPGARPVCRGAPGTREKQPRTGTISGPFDFPSKVIPGVLGFALSKTPLTAAGTLQTNIILLGYPSR